MLPKAGINLFFLNVFSGQFFRGTWEVPTLCVKSSSVTSGSKK